jgi:hypothetical protein
MRGVYFLLPSEEFQEARKSAVEFEKDVVTQRLQRRRIQVTRNWKPVRKTPAFVNLDLAAY